MLTLDNDNPGLNRYDSYGAGHTLSNPALSRNFPKGVILRGGPSLSGYPRPFGPGVGSVLIFGVSGLPVVPERLGSDPVPVNYPSEGRGAVVEDPGNLGGAEVCPSDDG